MTTAPSALSTRPRMAARATPIRLDVVPASQAPTLNRPHPAAETGPTRAPASWADPTISSSRSGMNDSKVIMPIDQKTSASDDAHEHPVAAEQHQAALDHDRGLAGLGEGVRDAGALGAGGGARLLHDDRRDDEVHHAERTADTQTATSRAEASSWPNTVAAGFHQMSRPESTAPMAIATPRMEPGPRELAGRRRRRASSRARCRRTTPRAAPSPGPGRLPSARPRRRTPRSSARSRRP